MDINWTILRCRLHLWYKLTRLSQVKFYHCIFQRGNSSIDSLWIMKSDYAWTCFKWQWGHDYSKSCRCRVLCGCIPPPIPPGAQWRISCAGFCHAPHTFPSTPLQWARNARSARTTSADGSAQWSSSSASPEPALTWRSEHSAPVLHGLGEGPLKEPIQLQPCITGTFVGQNTQVYIRIPPLRFKKTSVTEWGIDVNGGAVGGDFAASHDNLSLNAWEKRVQWGASPVSPALLNYGETFD